MNSFILRTGQFFLKTGIFVLLLTLCFAGAQAQTIRYVKPDGSGNGSSWADASNDLQAMINASASGDQIFVAAGTYKPNRKANATGTVTPNDRDNSFVLTNGVKVYGGFSGNEASLSNRNLSAGYISVLSGDFDGNDIITGSGSTLTISNNDENAHHVVISPNDAGNAVLDGFTITGGKYSEGTVQVGISNISRNHGGGIHITGSSPDIRNCIITGNDAGIGGGAYVSTGSSPSFVNSVFSKNMAGSTSGGGLYNSGGSGSATTITSCSFWGNAVSGASGGAISLLAPNSVVLRNSIVYGNKSGITGGPALVSYSLVQGSSSTSNGNINGNTDPLFVNAPGGDFHLQMTSPAVNKGSNALIPADVTTDITGNDRIADCIVDMGAYENALLPSASDQAFCGSGTLASLVATGQSLKWYSGASGGSPLDEATALSTDTYYVSQTIDGCESLRRAVSVTIHSIPSAPAATSSQYFCTGETAARLEAAGQNLQWYSVATEGMPVASETALVSGTYYVSQTVNGCESPRTAVSVTIVTRSAGNLTFTTQQQVDDFGTMNPCNNITVTNLTIGYASGTSTSNITDLSPLQNIILISGNLVIRNNPRLTSLSGLEALTGIGGFLTLHNNDALTHIDGLSALQSIGGNVLIQNNPALINVNGLHLVKNTGTLRIVTNHSLKDINGLSSVQQVEGQLQISTANSLENLNGLSSLTYVGAGLSVINLPLITDLGGLSLLKEVGGGLTVSENDALQTLTGLELLSKVDDILILTNPVLKNIDGLRSVTAMYNLRVFDNAQLENLNGLSSVTNARSSYIYIWKNTVLTDISGLQNINPATINGLTISDNPQLSVCNLPNFCTYLQGSGARAISGNATDCISVAAVTTTCTAPVAELSQYFCAGKTVAALVAAGKNLQWYSTEESDTPLVETTVLTSGTYYVSQTIGGFESPRTAVNVTVYVIPAAPVAVSSQYFCTNETVAGLVATGDNLQWYDVATGGAPLTTETALVSGTYYVSQTVNICESPRTAVSVTVHGIFTLTAEALTHPSPDSLTVGVLTFTTSGGDGSALLSYEKGGTPQTPASVTISSGKFTLTNLTVGVYTGFSLTDPVTGCPISGSASVTLYDRPGISDINVTGITSVNADISADIDAGDASTSATIIYGTDPDLVSGTQSAVLATDVTPAGSPAAKQAGITGLTANTTYYYKMILTNAYGSTKTATGSFTTLSDETALSSLVPDKGTLSPDFDSEIFSYEVTVSNADDKIRFTPTASSPLATITINNVPVSSGTLSGEIALLPGSNIVTITVTAEDPDVKQTYTVNVYRKQLQTITFPALADAVFGGVTPIPAATASSDLSVSYSSSDPDIAETYHDTEDGNKMENHPQKGRNSLHYRLTGR
ncbi:MAG: cadherin-like beta sandwich domain-containing protein [Leadbetterella sp.]|nr:cadherin-like beta sandwich domain-containing protein [Leadbetterella sp.]